MDRERPMRRLLALACLLFLIATGGLRAQDGAARLSAPVALAEDSVRPAGGQPTMPPPVPPPGYVPSPVSPNPFERIFANPFAQATEAGGQPARTFNENFDGDFGGVFYKRAVVTGFTTMPRVAGFSQQVTGFTPITNTVTQQVTTTDQLGRIVITNTITTTTTNNPIIQTVPVLAQDVVAQRRIVRLPLAARYSGILITDNDNPRPQDRVYFGYNFYNDIGGSLNPGLGEFDLQRQMIGFEKRLLGGDASFGMRLPFVQQYGPGFGARDVGDLTLIGKYAILNDRDTGDLWSAGLVLTTPTGSGGAILWDGSEAPHSVLFQPWTGFVRTFDRAYLQGVTSLIVPTDDRDPTLWNNSLGAGYYVYRGSGRWLTAVVPTAEVHVRTPLSRRDTDGSVFLQDQVNLTSGLHFRFNRSVFSGAVCVPVVGPRPWSVEAMAFLNVHF